MADLILALNPGNTSTKVALFRGTELVGEQTVRHTDEELTPFKRVMDQRQYRAKMIREHLASAGVKPGDLCAVVGRGGLLKPLASGTYRVNEAMIADLEKAARGEHASNLGAPIAAEIAGEHGCPAFIVDPVSVDEMEDVARLSGLKGVERQSLSHALNMKAVAKRHARTVERPYAEMRLIVAHLGSGVSVSAHRQGRMVDVINPKDEGPFSPDRVGGIPATALVGMCFQPEADAREIKGRLFGNGGLYSYLGTRDLREAMARVEQGDQEARTVVQAMCYQIGKSIGEMATVLTGQVDTILLTGGMAYSEAITEDIRQRVEWIAPVAVYPGEDELQALTEGALRVLRGEEDERKYE